MSLGASMANRPHGQDALASVRAAPGSLICSNTSNMVSRSKGVRKSGLGQRTLEDIQPQLLAAHAGCCRAELDAGHLPARLARCVQKIACAAAHVQQSPVAPRLPMALDSPPAGRASAAKHGGRPAGRRDAMAADAALMGDLANVPGVM